MSVAAIIQFLEGELARHGAEIVSVADLAALRAVEYRLVDARLADVDVSRAVAWVASLTPSADRDEFRRAFGEQAAALLDELVPSEALRRMPTSLLGGVGRMNLRAVWARATAGNDVDGRTIATALLAGEAEKASGSEDRKQLREILDIAVKEAQDAATRAALTEIRDGLVPQTGQPADNSDVQPVRPIVISVSIDVVGSTEAKRRLRDLATEEPWRAQLYKNFYTGFLLAEDRFYANLFMPGIWGHGPPLDWRSLFVVKGIGDELWLTYTVSPPEGADTEAVLQQAAVRLISAAMALTQSTVSCGGTSSDLGPNFDRKAEEQQHHDRMELPFKVSIDLVQDAIEISGQRLEYLAGRAGSYLNPPHGEADLREAAPFGATHVEILRRLNAGHFDLAGGHRLRQAYRTDYIGPDIDRFFRITKFALPGLVMVGDNLMQRLRFNVCEQLTPEIDRISLQFPADANRADNYVRTREPILRRRRSIASHEMKGVDAAYVVYHLIEVPALRGLLENATRNPFLEPTAAELPQNMRELIRPKASSGQPSGEESLWPAHRAAHAVKDRLHALAQCGFRVLLRQWRGLLEIIAGRADLKK